MSCDAGEVSESWRMSRSCDVGEAKEGLEIELDVGEATEELENGL